METHLGEGEGRTDPRVPHPCSNLHSLGKQWWTTTRDLESGGLGLSPSSATFWLCDPGHSLIFPMPSFSSL